MGAMFLTSMRSGFLFLSCWLLCSTVDMFAATADVTQDQAMQVEEETREVITSWASAWQSQLDDVYLLHYHPEFSPEAGNRESWEALRRRRILEPEEIPIGLRDFELSNYDAAQVQVRFWLVYTRPGYADRTHKEITLGKNGRIWQILRERNLEVIRLP